MPAYNSTTAFNDYLIGSREHYLNGGKVTNLTGYQRYLLDQFTKGKADSEVIQSGDEIRVNLNVSNPNNGGSILPGERVTRRNHNGLAQLTTGWRFDFDSYLYTEQEIELNKGAAQIVNLANQKRTSFRQGLHERLEAKLWATPSTTTMEGVGAREPYSIPCFITDDGNLPSGFSTLMNYAWTNLGNKVGTYTDIDNDSLIPQFDTMFRLLDWEATGAAAEWTDGTVWQKFLILTNGAGRDKFSKIIRNNQGGNVLVTNGKAGDVGVLGQAAMYNGVRVQWVPYTDGLSWTYPKYYCITTQFMHPVYHTTWYMKEKDPKEHPDFPLTWYVDCHSWWNFVCTARHRHGIIVGS